MWVIGIDEAGYGPNLGPLVQAAVTLELPSGDPAGWATLQPLVRRCADQKDARLLLDDSKKVYTTEGFAGLERGVWCANRHNHQTLGSLIALHASDHAATLESEGWYDAEEALPIESWARIEAKLPGVRSFAHLVPAFPFNRICDACGSKGAVLAEGLIALVRASMAAIPDECEAIAIHCDKHGGRNFYAAMVQQAFPDGWVITEVESPSESRYRIEMLACPISVTFKPRADAESVAVALASMTAKYLREVCMKQFNRFWAKHVPNIEPTAGYPVDAKRFYTQIQPAMAKLGLTAEQVWRKR